jgi:predicted acetyltransferase
MIFRVALPEERDFLFSEGYKEWPKNRTFAQYCTDNAKEDEYGTRYVLDVGGDIVSSLILLNLKDVAGKKAYGIGSVLTSKKHAGKGYATKLLGNVISQFEKDVSFIFLFSDINPDFYMRFGFRVLPDKLQSKSVCMVHCSDSNWHTLLKCPINAMPDYF